MEGFFEGLIIQQDWKLKGWNVKTHFYSSIRNVISLIKKGSDFIFQTWKSPSQQELIKNEWLYLTSKKMWKYNNANKNDIFSLRTSSMCKNKKIDVVYQYCRANLQRLKVMQWHEQYFYPFYFSNKLLFVIIIIMATL